MDHVIAIDLGGTQLRVALVTRDGQVVAYERTASRVQEGPAAVVERMLALIARLRPALPPGANLLGIGIGSPGPIDPYTGVIFAPPNMPGWGNVPLRALVAEQTGLHVELGNDANVAALGEWLFGGGRGLRDMVYVTVSTGIGGGVIVNGKLLLGRLGFGGELGYMIIDAERGLVWEDLASGTALGRAAALAMPEHPASLLHQLTTAEAVNGAHVAQAAARGDALASALMEREARYLGMGFASILHIFSPELVLVGGSVVLENPELLERARAIAHEHAIAELFRDVPIELAGLGDRAGVLGAAALIFAADEAR